jgi:hypothetical protein
MDAICLFSTDLNHIFGYPSIVHTQHTKGKSYGLEAAGGALQGIKKCAATKE